MWIVKYFISQKQREKKNPWVSLFHSVLEHFVFYIHAINGILKKSFIYLIDGLQKTCVKNTTKTFYKNGYFDTHPINVIQRPVSFTSTVNSRYEWIKYIRFPAYEKNKYFHQRTCTSKSLICSLSIEQQICIHVTYLHKTEQVQELSLSFSSLVVFWSLHSLVPYTWNSELHEHIKMKCADHATYKALHNFMLIHIPCCNNATSVFNDCRYHSKKKNYEIHNIANDKLWLFQLFFTSCGKNLTLSLFQITDSNMLQISKQT